ncbi:MAG: hypothetical protein OXU98_04120 [Gammaproteobacteria bacterium]|nr:hypothetical protein [Gammaproteobacteria bacterium]
MKFAATITAVISSIAIVGCSSSPKNIDAVYVSPAVYASYDCDQITQEMTRVGRKISEVTGHQSDESGKDAAAMGVGLVLFWPALFFLAGGNDRAEELGRLKGELEALEVAAIQKKCTGLLERIEAERKAAKEAENTESDS